MQLGSSRQRPRFVPKTSICQPPSAMGPPLSTGRSTTPASAARLALPSSNAGPKFTLVLATAPPASVSAPLGFGAARTVASW